MKLLLCLVALTVFVTAKMPKELAEKYSVEYLEGGDSDVYPASGSKAEVHYTGTLLNGKKFDSSKDRSQPFTFTVGQQQVIVCWDQVVSHLAKGDKVNVLCPSNTAYGPRAMGPIPANSDLKFQIQMLAFY